MPDTPNFLIVADMTYLITTNHDGDPETYRKICERVDGHTDGHDRPLRRHERSWPRDHGRLGVQGALRPFRRRAALPGIARHRRRQATSTRRPSSTSRRSRPTFRTAWHERADRPHPLARRPRTCRRVLLPTAACSCRIAARRAPCRAGDNRRPPSGRGRDRVGEPSGRSTACRRGTGDRPRARRAERRAGGRSARFESNSG